MAKSSEIEAVTTANALQIGAQGVTRLSEHVPGRALAEILAGDPNQRTRILSRATSLEKQATATLGSYGSDALARAASLAENILASAKCDSLAAVRDLPRMIATKIPRLTKAGDQEIKAWHRAVYEVFGMWVAGWFHPSYRREYQQQTAIRVMQTVQLSYQTEVKRLRKYLQLLVDLRDECHTARASLKWDIAVAEVSLAASYDRYNEALGRLEKLEECGEVVPTSLHREVELLNDWMDAMQLRIFQLQTSDLSVLGNHIPVLDGLIDSTMQSLMFYDHLATHGIPQAKVHLAAIQSANILGRASDAISTGYQDLRNLGVDAPEAITQLAEGMQDASIRSIEAMGNVSQNLEDVAAMMKQRARNSRERNRVISEQSVSMEQATAALKAAVREARTTR